LWPFVLDADESVFAVICGDLRPLRHLRFLFDGGYSGNRRLQIEN
jgi:hypothetical protein